MARSADVDLRIAIARADQPIPPKYLIAACLHTHPSTFSAWLTGRVAFDPDVLTRLPAAILEARELQSRRVAS